MKNSRLTTVVFILIIVFLGNTASGNNVHPRDVWPPNRYKQQDFSPEWYYYKFNIGLTLGNTYALTDIGGRGIGSSWSPNDTQFSLMNPLIGLSFRRYLNRNMSSSILIELNATSINGDDRLIPDSYPSPGFKRKIRGLNFKSIILEQLVSYQWNLFSRRVVSPFVNTGIGFTYFNPKAQYKGQWIALRPLGTEGQWISGYGVNKTYGNFAGLVSLGGGARYTFHLKNKKTIDVFFECKVKLSSTDYLDDVSTNYIPTAAFYEFYDTEKAELASALARRTFEVNSSMDFAHITEPGKMRGDSSDNDAYYSFHLRIEYRFQKRMCIGKRH